MCGIAGIFAYDQRAPAVDMEELRAIRDHMKMRGPDGFGEWCSENGRLGLAHRRLSIIDLSDNASQPMASGDGVSIVTYNGEIYNYQALRRQLEQKGWRFRTQSDTEVLLHLYAEKGDEMVYDLRGMYAFAIWDEKKQELFLARDPYGIKPLYYADDGLTFRFASQVKALLAGGAISKDPEPAGWVGFYLFGSVPEPFTTYRNIRLLPAGNTLRVTLNGSQAPRPFFSLAETCAKGNEEGLRPIGQEEVREALLDSVRHHLVADVPVGAFLSAGIDSGALVGLMRDAGQQEITTVTLSFEEYRGRHDDEAPLAEQVARLYGTRHHTRVVTEREFHDDLPHILEAMDQPTIDGINTWFVSKAANELGLKVAISGLGGDELFGGYPSFRDVPRWVRLFGLPSKLPGLGPAARWLLTRVNRLHPVLSPKAAGLLEYAGTWPGAWLLRRGVFMPWELDQIMDRQMARQGLASLDPLRHIELAMTPDPGSDFARVAVLESALYMRNQLLRDTDWASMAHSLEVRVPLVDMELLQKTAPSLGIQPGKRALASAPGKSLPKTVTIRRKTGFTTPIADWQKKLLPENGITTGKQPPALNGPWSRRWAFEVKTRVIA